MTLFSCILVQPVFAIGLECTDPDVVFCMDLADGWGTVARDSSKTGANGTLVGGPAWVQQSAARPTWNPTKGSTYAYAHSPPNHIQFTHTAGEHITTVNTTVGDFSGSKPGMLAFVMKQNDSNTPAACNNQVIWGWGAALGGWRFRMCGGGGYVDALELSITAVASICFLCENAGQCSCRFPDHNPHSYGVWFDGAGNFLMFQDGKLERTVTGIADFATEANTGFTVALAQGGNEWGGEIWGLRVWKAIVSRHQAEQFFKAYHDKFIYGGN